MIDSFLKRWPSLQGPPQDRKLLGPQGPGGQLLKRAEGNPVGLPQGAIDRSGFGHAHLGMVEDEG